MSVNFSIKPPGYSSIFKRMIPLVLAGRKLKAKAMTNPQNQTYKSRGKSWPIKQLLPAIACKKISWNQFLVGFVTHMCICWRMFLQDPCFVHVGSCPVKTRIACRGLCIFLIISSLALSPFKVVTSCLIAVRVCPWRFPLFMQMLFPCLRHLWSCFLRRNVNPH